MKQEWHSQIFIAMVKQIQDDPHRKSKQDLQQIVSDGMAEATAYANEVLAEEEAEMLKEMTDGGVEYIELTDESRQEFKDATASVWPMLQEQYPEFYDVFVSALERTQK